jgi:energy-coupling factor transporter ATP-binding protein EcfA2
MRQTSYRTYGRLVALLAFLAAVATAVVFYVVCFLAIHTTIALGSAVSSSSRRSTDARADGVVTALVTAAAWTFLLMAVIIAATGTYDVWPAGLGLGLPIGLVIGWQVGRWQEAVSWSRAPGSAIVGQCRQGRFLVSRPYTVTPPERLKHLVISGPTGSGKSTLVRNMVLRDMEAGAGICVIDPKDDLIDGILPHVPESRVDDVINFDVTDTERPLGLNPFAGVAPEQRSLAASELIAVFRRYFADAWGARLEHVLRNAVLALLEVPSTTLLDVPRLLLDRAFLRWVVGHVENQAVREFLLVEYEEVLRRRSDAVEPILNKVGPWLSYPELSAIMGQERSAFDVRQVMDRGQMLFVRIPQGAFGEDVSNLLGALVVAKVQLAAQSRVNVPVEARRPFFLYVDEFQNFATSSFTRILTEGRAFGLGVVCVNQYAEQLSRDLQLALARNAATFVKTSYRRGHYIAEVLRQEDADEKKPPVYVIKTPPPLPRGNADRADQVRAASRERYGRPPQAEALTGTVRSARKPAGREESVAALSRDLDEE